MDANWQLLCRGKRFEVDHKRVCVTFDDQRKHWLTVIDEGDSYLLRGRVAPRRVVESVRDLPIRVWLRNRTTSLIGFRIDSKSRLVGEVWVPKVGLVAEEFQLYLSMLASECDRFEYLLTGADLE